MLLVDLPMTVSAVISTTMPPGRIFVQAKAVTMVMWRKVASGGRRHPAARGALPKQRGSEPRITTMPAPASFPA